MAKATTVQKMRWIAGGIYTFYFFYQMLLFKGIISMASITQIPMASLGELALAVGGGAMAVWMFLKKTEVAEGARRAVVVGTLLAVLFELLYYTTNNDMARYTLLSTDVLPFSLFVTESNLGIMQFIFALLRMMLIILAAFFVTSARDGIDEEVAGEEDAEDEEGGEEEGEGSEIDEESDEEEQALPEEPGQDTEEELPKEETGSGGEPAEPEKPAKRKKAEKDK